MKLAPPLQLRKTKRKEGEGENPEEEIDEKIEIQKFTEAELNDKAMKEYEEQCYSPKLIHFGDVDEEKWLKPAEDSLKLSYLREKVKSGSTVEEELEAQNMFNTEALGEGEETFNNPVALKLQKFAWSDKYRPRKPRFFNRVHTGYEWNKYNQTHYDQDNPPPKIVQGYKFNIFYPDLIDKTHTPEFTLTQCDEDPDFAILRFKTGPPYEDIAFKIVDREWECSNRHGFRCQFYNNIFQLYFHFKRYRYRR
ncbi:splicing factor Cactin-like isoform X2 [Clytia hemisphaerica]|uniref:splicing factor Cactin-like isoform X2 n=1 Tax=Clytia hemisphaerica TaxID=252671 RepID=UPI0034D7BB96